MAHTWSCCTHSKDGCKNSDLQNDKRKNEGYVVAMEISRPNLHLDMVGPDLDFLADLPVPRPSRILDGLLRRWWRSSQRQFLLHIIDEKSLSGQRRRAGRRLSGRWSVV
ncbi:hypothetical protein ACFX2J_046305 [Malus domestica]